MSFYSATQDRSHSQHTQDRMCTKQITIMRGQTISFRRARLSWQEMLGKNRENDAWLSERRTRREGEEEEEAFHSLPCVFLVSTLVLIRPTAIGMFFVLPCAVTFVYQRQRTRAPLTKALFHQRISSCFMN